MILPMFLYYVLSPKLYLPLLYRHLYHILMIMNLYQFEMQLLCSCFIAGIHQSGIVQHPHHATERLPLGHQRINGSLGVADPSTCIPAT